MRGRSSARREGRVKRGCGIGIERILAPLLTTRVSPEGTVRDSAVWLSEVGAARRSRGGRRVSCRPAPLASGQAVRRLTLDQEIEGSNPSSPAIPPQSRTTSSAAGFGPAHRRASSSAITSFAATTRSLECLARRQFVQGLGLVVARDTDRPFSRSDGDSTRWSTGQIVRLRLRQTSRTDGLSFAPQTGPVLPLVQATWESESIENPSVILVSVARQPTAYGFLEPSERDSRHEQRQRDPDDRAEPQVQRQMPEIHPVRDTPQTRQPTGR